MHCFPVFYTIQGGVCKVEVRLGPSGVHVPGLTERVGGGGALCHFTYKTASGFSTLFTPLTTPLGS